MATVEPTLTDVESRVTTATWVLADGDVGAAVRHGGSADRSVQIAGTFGGATITLQGTIDGTNWATLTDAQGDAISKTSAAIEAVTELVRYIRPVVTGGTGVNVTVSLLMRQTI